MTQSSFGTDFIIINDTVQELDSKIFGGGPWVHKATIVRGLDEYIVFYHLRTNNLYIEKIARHQAAIELQKIKDDSEWDDIYRFCMRAGLLTVGIKDREIKVGKKGLPGFSYQTEQK